MQAYNRIGQELYHKLSALPGNIVLSPYSIGTAMAMVLAGARGETEAEMRAVLRHARSSADIGAANRSVRAALATYGGSFWFLHPAPTRLLTANALMVKREANVFANAYTTLLKADYGAELLGNINNEAIDDWVRRKTEGHIRQITGDVTFDFMAVLLNAVYFKAEWADRFEARLTRDQPFRLSPSETVTVPFLHRQGDYAVALGDGFRAIRLPYRARTVSLVIVLPDAEDQLDAVSRRLDGEAFPKLLADLQSLPHKIDLSLPRFTAAFNAKLRDQFEAMGMTRAFDRLQADFSGMSQTQHIWLGDVVHKATIEIFGRRYHGHCRNRRLPPCFISPTTGIPGRSSIPVLSDRRSGRRGAVSGSHRRSAVIGGDTPIRLRRCRMSDRGDHSRCASTGARRHMQSAAAGGRVRRYGAARQCWRRQPGWRRDEWRRRVVARGRPERRSPRPGCRGRRPAPGPGMRPARRAARRRRGPGAFGPSAYL